MVAFGCAGLTPPPAPFGDVDLPTLSGIPPDAPPAVVATCGGMALEDAVVHGQAEAVDPVWFERVKQPPVATQVRRPAGFTARFTPRLEIVDADGVIVAREGDTVTKIGGQMGADGRFEIWDFNGRSYSCY